MPVSHPCRWNSCHDIIVIDPASVFHDAMRDIFLRPDPWTPVGEDFERITVNVGLFTSASTDSCHCSTKWMTAKPQLFSVLNKFLLKHWPQIINFFLKTPVYPSNRFSNNGKSIYICLDIVPLSWFSPPAGDDKINLIGDDKGGLYLFDNDVKLLITNEEPV